VSGDVEQDDIVMGNDALQPGINANIGDSGMLSNCFSRSFFNSIFFHIQDVAPEMRRTLLVLKPLHPIK
jgi:hypothetical protein